MDWAVPFIGRDNELQVIHQQLLAWQTRRVLFVWGDGGVGKTRLLDEVGKRFDHSAENIIKILPIIDFDDDKYKLSQNLGFSIAQQLDRHCFEPYLNALSQLYLAEKWAFEQGKPLLTERHGDVNQTFIDCFNQASYKQRIVLRIDTTETLQNATPLTYLLDMASHLQNVLILVAGRDGKQLYQQYQAQLQDDALLLALPAFAVADSRDYLQCKQSLLKVSLNRKWMDKLFFLVGGRPVLIDLAIEWAQAHRTLPWMESLSLAELEQLQQKADAGDEPAQLTLGDMQAQFQREVVMPIADLESPLDYLKLVLAKVYPLDQAGIIEMLNLSEEEGHELIQQALDSVAIKRLPDARLKLQDVVQDLVNQHVWPALDPNRAWERRENRRSIRYLTSKSDALLAQIGQGKQSRDTIQATLGPSELLQASSTRRERENEFWILRIERLRRQLTIDVEAGYGQFEEDYQLASSVVPSANGRYGLLSVIEPYAAWNLPAPDMKGNVLREAQQITVLRLLARQMTFAGMYHDSAPIYEQLLKIVPPDSEEYIATLYGQANQLARIGKLQQSLQVTEQALQVANQLQHATWQIGCTIDKGWIYHLMGDLPQALSYYEAALKLAYQHDHIERIAKIYNNRAYVLVLLNQYSQALNEVKQAIRLWEQLAQNEERNRFSLAQSYHTAGEIYLELEQPSDALPYFEHSLALFEQEEVRGSEWKSQSRAGRGFAYWQLAWAKQQQQDDQSAQQYLTYALADLKWAAAHATTFNRASVLNRLGEVYFLLNSYAEAEQTWQEGLQTARQVEDALNALHSLANLARLSRLHPVQAFATWQAFEHYYTEQYSAHYVKPHSDLMLGLFYSYLGHLALQQAQLSDAIRLYQRGLPLLSEQITYAPFNLISQLNLIQNELLPQLPVPLVRQLGNELKQWWLENGHDMVALLHFREWSLYAV